MSTDPTVFRNAVNQAIQTLDTQFQAQRDTYINSFTASTTFVRSILVDSLTHGVLEFVRSFLEEPYRFEAASKAVTPTLKFQDLIDQLHGGVDGLFQAARNSASSTPGSTVGPVGTKPRPSRP
jgi:hypothetical protein